MSDKIVNTSIVKDEGLALLIKQLSIKHAPEFNLPAPAFDFDEDSPTGQLMIKVAHEINQTVIKPASERAAAYILRTHHKALYDALPVGEVDAFDLAKVVNDHLDKVSLAIRTLEASGTPEAETVEAEESK